MIALKEVIIVVVCTLQYVAPLRGPLDDPDFGLNTSQMIRNHGYSCQIHTILTEDGYILTYQRISHRENDRDTAKKPAVLLMHGLFGSSVDYVTMGPKRSLGYILADNGYDVWLANARGSTWSRNHTKYDVNKDSQKFFDFSWHEIGYYDLPAAIDYILRVTKENSLYYVGHSQGGTVFLVLMSTRPEYNKKIKLASLLAPASFMGNISHGIVLSLIKILIEQLEIFAIANKLYEIHPSLALFRKASVEFCSHPFNIIICETILFLVFGADPLQFDPVGDLCINKVAVLLANSPTPVALKQCSHYGQLILNGEFCQFDHGRTKNIKIYGKEKPPSYNLTRITAPVAVYYGKSDLQVNLKDVRNLIHKLPNVPNEYLVPYDLFNHLDFIHAIDVVKLLYREVIKVMRIY